MTTLIIPKQESTANSVSIFLDHFVVVLDVTMVA